MKRRNVYGKFTAACLYAARQMSRFGWLLQGLADDYVTRRVLKDGVPVKQARDEWRRGWVVE